MTKDIIDALKLVLVSLDSMLIPGVEANKMEMTRAVVEECIMELEANEHDCESDPSNG